MNPNLIIYDEMSTYNVDQVNEGGLMRCCTETLGGLYPDGPARVATEGQILPCRWCRESMVFTAGAWNWNRADSGFSAAESHA